MTLRACLNFAVRNEWVARNVAQIVQAPSRDSDREPVLFDERTIAAVILAISDTELEGPATFALGTGARRGEICALRWEDIDLDNVRYAIRRTAAHVDNQVIYKKPKSKTSLRSDILAPSVADALLRHQQRQQALWNMLGLGRLGRNSLVFTRADGTPWKPNELSRQFSRLVRRKQLPHIRFHDLRHGHASVAFAAGVPLRTISESIGNSSIAVTARIYVHLLEEGRRDKATRVDKYFSKALSQ